MMNPLMRALTLSVALTALLLPVALAQTPQPFPLVGTTWRLAAFGPADSLPPVVENSLLTLSFGTDQRAFGSGGCNSFGGPFSQRGTQLSFGMLVSTLIACADEAVMQQEIAYLQALQAARSYEILDQKLIIRDDAGQVMIFERYNPLASTQWSLLSFGATERPTIPMPERPVTLIFDDLGQVSGLAGCNNYAGSAQVEAERLSFGPLVRTEMFCTEEGLMAQEDAFLAALSAAERYVVNGSELVLNYPDGQIIFTRTYDLVGTLWTLEGFSTGSDMIPALGDVTLKLDAEGRAAGLAGCNNYGATYEVEGDSLRFGPAVSTKKSCADEAVMQQELAYLQALSQATRYRIEEGQLIIELEDSQRLTFLSDQAKR